MEQEGPQPILLYHRRGLALLLALMCGLLAAGLLAALVWLVVDAYRPATPRALVQPGALVVEGVLALLGIAFFIFGAWFALWHVPRTPALAVTADGIVDHVSPVVNLGLIRWEDIRKVRSHKRWPVRSVAIWSHHPDVLLDRRGRLARSLLAFERRAGDVVLPSEEYPTTQLSFALVAGDVDQLVARIEREFAATLAHYGIVAGKDPWRENASHR